MVPNESLLLLMIAEPEPEHDPITNLLSTPFSHRFNGLVQRLAEHKGLFDVDLRAGRHTSLEDFIKKVSQNIVDRDHFVKEREVRQHLEKEMKNFDSKDSGQNFFDFTLTMKVAFHESIRNWVQPTEPKVDFDRAKKVRNFGSCAWLQSEPTYVSWKAEPQTSELGPGNYGSFKARSREPILWMEGEIFTTSDISYG